jgi:hypothetical protein
MNSMEILQKLSRNTSQRINTTNHQRKLRRAFLWFEEATLKPRVMFEHYERLENEALNCNVLSDLVWEWEALKRNN